MVGSSVMFTPKGLSVVRRVSRIASRSASGLGCVSAVRIPVGTCELRESNSGALRTYRDRLHWKPLRRERALRPIACHPEQ
jgi:hypothetical protein